MRVRNADLTALSSVNMMHARRKGWRSTVRRDRSASLRIGLGHGDSGRPIFMYECIIL